MLGLPSMCEILGSIPGPWGTVSAWLNCPVCNSLDTKFNEDVGHVNQEAIGDLFEGRFTMVRVGFI